VARNRGVGEKRQDKGGGKKNGRKRKCLRSGKREGKANPRRDSEPARDGKNTKIIKGLKGRVAQKEGKERGYSKLRMKRF